MNTDIWVMIEAESGGIDRHSQDLLQEGKRLSAELGGQLHALYLGPEIADMGQAAGSRGVVKIFACPGERMRHCGPWLYEEPLLTLLRDQRPALLLALAASPGADLMARLAATLAAPLITACNEIDVQPDGGMRFTKSIHNGRLQASYRCMARGIKMATLVPRRLASDITAAAGQGAAEVIVVETSTAPARLPVQVTGYIRADHRTVDIREAETIVAVGRGIGSRENFKTIEAFADRIGGALAGTRPVIDAGLLPYERQIGQTGKCVSPRLIFLCGISGAMEFIKGIEHAGTRVAINLDRRAPIFKSVDLAIVGDLTVLVPEILEHINGGAHADMA